MTPSLSETFEPPRTTTYGRSGSTVSRRSTSISVAHQPAHGVRQPLGDVVHAGLLAVHDAEPVGDERIGQRGQLVGERAALGVVLAGLARVEPDVLQQRDLAVGQAFDRRPGATHRRCRWRTRRRHRAARRAGRPRGPASTRSSGAPFGRPRCAATTTRAPASASSRMVGTLARIRPSSVIAWRVPSSGTLRSERTRTRLPPTSPRVASSPPTVRGSRRCSRSGRRGGWSSPTRCRTSRRP